MKLEIESALNLLASRSSDPEALAALSVVAAGGRSDPVAARAWEDARRIQRERGNIELLLQLLDLDLDHERSAARRATLWVERARLLSDDLWRETEAMEALEQALTEHPDDPAAKRALAHAAETRGAWQRIAAKFLEEAEGASDRQLQTSLLTSVAELFAKYGSDPKGEVERHLQRALEVEPRNRRAAHHLTRLYRSSERWSELAVLLEQRIEVSASREERAALGCALGDLQGGALGQPGQALATCLRVLELDRAHPQALPAVARAFEAAQNWQALAKIYDDALRVRAGTDMEAALLRELGLLWWRRLGQAEVAEGYFQRLRRSSPAQPDLLEFYRSYHCTRNEPGKLLQVLSQAQKVVREPADRLALSLEMAELAERSPMTVEKAIDLWKSVLKQSPGHLGANEALERLYQRTEKWNALIDLLKEQIEVLPEGERVAKWLTIAAIYRERLNLDVMVVNTYNTVLALDPRRADVLEALGERYQAMGRWNDLIGVLGRWVELQSDDREGRAAKATLLRRIAALWLERFGNHAQAQPPLEELHALVPGDRDVVAQLRDIYTRRRAFRALLDLERSQVDRLVGLELRAKLVEMAQLATDRLNDLVEAIGLWNRLLEIDPEDEEALSSLVELYEREKRWAPLIEVYRRRRARLSEPRQVVPLLEKIGALWTEKFGAGEQAIAVYQEILELVPTHSRAVRSLRELFAEAGDFGKLEALYTGQGQWGEACDALLGAAERVADDAIKIQLYRRVAELSDSELHQPERVQKALERILAIDPQDARAAAALVPFYREAEKWPRLVGCYEVLLRVAPGDADRLELLQTLRELCEERLGSLQLAFLWCSRAYALRPGDAELLRELDRLGHEAEAHEELAAIYVQDLDRLPEGETRIERLRQLGELMQGRLNRPAEARRYFEEVLARRPADDQANTVLERLYTDSGAVAELLALSRQQLEHEAQPARRAELLFRIAWLAEERQGDLPAAQASYRQLCEEQPDSPRALQALERVCSARGDHAGLSDVLDRQLALSEEDPEAEVALAVRLGELWALHLGDPARALRYYRRALARQPEHRPTIAALERYLAPGEPSRLEVAQLLRPVYERLDEPQRLAEVLAIELEAAPSPNEEGALLKQLSLLVGRRLGDVDAAYAYAVRRFALAPEDGEVRRELAELADLLDRHAEWAQLLGSAIDRVATAGLGRDLAVELAEQYEQKLGDPDAAMALWRKALEFDPDHEGAYRALERRYRATQRYPELHALYLARKAQAFDPALRRDVLLQICELCEGPLADVVAAEASYRELAELDPGSPRPLQALERIYVAADQWRALDSLYGRAIDGAVRTEERVALEVKRAELRLGHLEDPEAALELLEAAVADDPRHEGARRGIERLMAQPELRLRAARLLEPLYFADQAWPRLGQVLAVQREGATGHEAVALLGRMAELVEEKMGARQQALGLWREALKIDPSDENVRTQVDRLGAVLGRWNELAATWVEAADLVPPTEFALRSDLLTRAARLYEERLSDRVRARAIWQRLYEIDPESADLARPAAEALLRIYEAERAWPELREVLRRRAAWGDGPELWVRVASIEELQLGDRSAAIATYRQLLDAVPDHGGALDALERLHTAAGEWRELCELLRRRARLAPERSRDLLWQAAGVLAERLHSAEAHPEVIAAYQAVLEVSPDDRPALEVLADLHERAGQWPELWEVLDRQLGMERVASAQLELRARIAQLLEGPLGRPSEALAHYRELLARAPGHTGAREGLERLLADPEVRLAAAALLEPIYQAADHGRGEPERLIALCELWAEHSPDVRERIARLSRIAALREASPIGRNESGRRAIFETLGRAARLAVGEPELAGLLAGLERVGEGLLTGELCALYRELSPEVLDPLLQQRLYLGVAERSLILGDRATARDYYRRVLDDSPQHRAALEALEQLHRDGREIEPLLEIYHRRIELAFGDEEERRDYLALAAELCEGELGRPSDAAACYEQILELFPADPAAADALERLYLASGRFLELGELLERRLGFADELSQAVALHVRLGKLQEAQLGDSKAAFENFRAALNGDPEHGEALAAVERFLMDPVHRLSTAELLEPIYSARSDWRALVRLAEIRLEVIDDAAPRLALLRRIAHLHEEQLEDLVVAWAWHVRVFREAPEDCTARAEVARLAHVLDRPQDLAAVYQTFLDEVLADNAASRKVAEELAALYQRLGQPEAAKRCYERLLSGSLEQELRGELLLKYAQLQEVELGDPEAAIESYRTLSDLQPESQEAAWGLDRLYVAHQRWHDLAELLRSQSGRTETAAALPIQLRLGALYESQLADLPTAIDFYEEVLTTGSGPTKNEALGALERLLGHPESRLRVAQLLEPHHRASGDRSKLVAVLEAQIEASGDRLERVERRIEVARLQLERGVPERAFEALAQAWQEVVVDGEEREEALYRQLASLAERQGLWSELVKVALCAVAGSYDDELVARVRARVAGIEELQLGDPAAAIASWRQVVAVREEEPAAWSALERLLEKTGQWSELCVVLERHAERASEPLGRRELLVHAAGIYERSLGRTDLALAAWRRVVGIDDTDREALAQLAQLLKAADQPRERALVLERQIELSSNAVERRHHRLELAALYQQLGDALGAQGIYRAAVEEDPHDREMLEALVRLYEQEEQWSDLVDVLDALAQVGSPEESQTLGYRAARILDEKQGEPLAAVERYRCLIEVAPDHAAARAALEALVEREESREAAAAVLEPLYRLQEQREPLVQLFMILLRAENDPMRRATLWAEVAELEEAVGHRRAAFDAWARLLTEAPEQDAPLAPLERLAAAEGNWAELARIYQERIGAVWDPEVQRELGRRLGALQSERLGDALAAIESYRKLVELGDEEVALAALDPLLQSVGQRRERAEVVGRRAELAEQPEIQADLFFQHATLLQELGAREEALRSYREALERKPTHAATRAALGRLVESGKVEDALGALDLLEPLAQRENDLGWQLSLVEARLRRTPSAELHLRAAAFSEGSGREAHYRQALEIDSASEEALGALEAIYRQSGKFERLAEVLERRSGVDRDPAVQRACRAELGRLRLEELDDIDGAIAAWRTVRDEDPGDREALVVLGGLYRRTARWRDLVETLEQQAREDVESRATLQREIATLWATQLGDRERALEAYRELADLEPDPRDALGVIEELESARQNWGAVEEVLLRRIGLEERAMRGAIYRRLVEVAQARGAASEAVAYGREWVELAPQEEAAHRALEQLLEEQERWQELVAALQHHAEERQGGERLVLLSRAVETVRVRLDDSSRARQLVELILLEQPDQPQALVELATLCEADEDWKGAQAALELAVARAQGAEAAELHLRLAKLHRQVGDSAAAERHWERALDGAPEPVEAIEGLESLARERGDEARVAALMERRLERVPPTEQRNLGLKLAKLYRTSLVRPAEEVRLLERLRTLAPDDLEILEPLAERYLQMGRFDEAQPLLERLVERIQQDPSRRRSKDLARLQFRLGQVAEQRGQAERALLAFTAAQQLDPGHAPTLSALGRHFAAVHNWEQARRFYRALLLQTLAPDTEINKADIYLALGEIHERTDEAPKAVGMYERGLELDARHEGLRRALARAKGVG